MHISPLDRESLAAPLLNWLLIKIPASCMVFVQWFWLVISRRLSWNPSVLWCCLWFYQNVKHECHCHRLVACCHKQICIQRHTHAHRHPIHSRFFASSPPKATVKKTILSRAHCNCNFDVIIYSAKLEIGFQAKSAGTSSNDRKAKRPNSMQRMYVEMIKKGNENLFVEIIPLGCNSGAIFCCYLCEIDFIFRRW